MATHEVKLFWHDLTENPEDLPKEKCGRYLISAHIKDEKIVYPYIYTLDNCIYSTGKRCWYDRNGYELDTAVVVAWAEMPWAYIPDSKKAPKKQTMEEQPDDEN